MLGWSQKKPHQSRIKLEYRFSSESVLRKHPSHYVQKIEGNIIYFPNEFNEESETIGNFTCYLSQIRAAVRNNFTVQQIFTDNLAYMAKLFSSNDLHQGNFRKDLKIDPCDSILFLDEFKINDSIYRHDSFIKQCVEEIAAIFVQFEIIAIRRDIEDIPMTILNEMNFARVTRTNLAVRDNALIASSDYSCGY